MRAITANEVGRRLMANIPSSDLLPVFHVWRIQPNGYGEFDGYMLSSLPCAANLLQVKHRLAVSERYFGTPLNELYVVRWLEDLERYIDGWSSQQLLYDGRILPRSPEEHERIEKFLSA